MLLYFQYLHLFLLLLVTLLLRALLYFYTNLHLFSILHLSLNRQEILGNHLHFSIATFQLI